MFGLFNKAKAPTAKRHAAFNELLDYAYNAATLTWQNMFGVLKSEDMFSSQSDYALKLAAVKCALDIYTGMTTSLPRRMYSVESGSLRRLKIINTTDHPASRLFSHYFNPDLTSDDALSIIVYDVLMDGNCYFMREFDGQSRTSRLYYIHPSRIPRRNIQRAQGGEDLVTNRKAVSGELIYRIDSGQSYRDKNTEAFYAPKDMIVHFKNKVLDTEYHRGHGFIANSKRTVDMYQASEEFGWKFYTKGIATQMFLTTDNRLDAQVLKRIEANFTDDPDAPLESIFKTRVLEQGLKPVHMGIPFQHLQFIETRAFSVEDIARGFNTPPALLHSYMGTKAGDADLAQAVSLFVQTGIGPFLDRIGSQFRTELLPLPSQMLFTFEFEKLYLYRNVIDKFSSSLRNLFEIGILDRTESRALLGLHIDPSDAASNPRYVPVNLMTVEHSLLLEKQAEIANETAESNLEMLDLQKDSQRKSNDGMVAAPVATPDSPNATSESDLNNAPSSDNIDKRLRSANNQIARAYLNVLNGLRQYEARVLDQKKQTRVVDYADAVKEFYASDSKFTAMLNEQLLPWDSLLNGVTDFSSRLITNWISSQKYPEGMENELPCSEP